MTRSRVTVLLIALATVAAVLAGAAPRALAPTAESAGASAQVAAPAVASGPDRALRPPPRGDRVRIEGAVRRPVDVTVTDLASDYEQQTVTTTFTAQGQPTTRTFTGPLLLDVLTAAEPRFDGRRSNDQLAFAVRVGATDGYRAVVAWGEIDPGFAGTQVLLATTEDGRRLTRPRLVVPGDARGGRYVTDVLDVRLLDLGDARR